MNKIVFVLSLLCVVTVLNAFSARRCGEPWTRTACDTCSSCPLSDCDSCRSCPCSRAPCNSCSSDPECSCLKAAVGFPDVEYPMSVIEMKPYFCGTCY